LRDSGHLGLLHHAHKMAQVAIPQAHVSAILQSVDTFKQTYPVVIEGIKVGAVPYDKLVEKSIVVPLHKVIDIPKEMARTPSHVTAIVKEQLYQGLMVEGGVVALAPKLASRLLDQLAQQIYAEIEHAIKEAEKDRTVVQVITRKDVASTLTMLKVLHSKVDEHECMQQISGRGSIIRQKATFGENDMLKLELRLDFKQVLMNSAKLVQLNEDPRHTLRDKIEAYDPLADLLA